MLTFGLALAHSRSTNSSFRPEGLYVSMFFLDCFLMVTLCEILG